MTVKDHDSIETLLERARRETRPRVARRLQAVAMARRGLSGPRIAELTGEPLRNLERWVKRYNEQGVDGLVDEPRPGRPPKLAREKEEAFRERVDAGPTDTDQAAVLHGHDYCGILEREFEVVYTLDGVYKLLRRLGYSWLMPRPEHEKADPEAQEAFKKTSVKP